ncbi:hypothetical protein [Aestuariivivens insulae]|uniref:hypothetical protein n=1 Tax=Aestuariivivens insulae TaxID=1621988 RepID=UPI001F57FEE7|nr:hypothetical protein [Aestuariivivens insulae]
MQTTNHNNPTNLLVFIPSNRDEATPPLKGGELKLNGKHNAFPLKGKVDLISLKKSKTEGSIAQINPKPKFSF